jgi:hypothetical protein
LLLGANLFIQKNIMSNTNPAAIKIEYRAEPWLTGEALQLMLDKYANDGWEFVGNAGGYPYIIFKKVK